MSVQEHIDRTMTWLAENTSRRGLFARAGRWGLVVLGVTAGEVLPVGPIPVASAFDDCTNPFNCGLHGWDCSCCNPGGGCPSGTTSAGSLFWDVCCFDGSQWYKMRYSDCCYNGTPCSPNCCPGCPMCTNGPPQPDTWCGTNGNAYKCTLVGILAINPPDCGGRLVA